MTDLLVDTAPPATTFERRATVSAAVEVVRDIARGGITGIIVGLLVAGLGGRVVMRLAALLHPDTAGLFTENGEEIGRITLNGTLALMVFGGLGMGLMAGTIWVIASPWIPGRGVSRALVTAIAAIALGTPSLVERTNPDFVILDHDPLVVTLLVGLVGFVGFSFALVDRALDTRLPRPRRPIAISTAVYVVVTLLGLVLILPRVVAILLDHPEYSAPIRAGWALAFAGVCTLTWWVLRVMGRPAPPRALRLAGAASLVVAGVLGVVTSLPQILGAAGIAG